VAQYADGMNRVLALVLSLAFVSAAAATPAVACVGTATLGSQHGCCGDRAVAAAPAGICCVLSQSTLTESRNSAATDRPADLVATHQAAWFQSVDAGLRGRGSTSPPGPPPVPIYIQQLSLLI
jgi:hypothetical protein